MTALLSNSDWEPAFEPLETSNGCEIRCLTHAEELAAVDRETGVGASSHVNQAAANYCAIAAIERNGGDIAYGLIVSNDGEIEASLLGDKATADTPFAQEALDDLIDEIGEEIEIDEPESGPRWWLDLDVDDRTMTALMNEWATLIKSGKIEMSDIVQADRLFLTTAADFDLQNTPRR